MNCHECNAEITDRMNFCTDCGTNLHESFGTNLNRRGQNDQPNLKTRTFKCNKIDFEGKVTRFQGWLRSEGFETQKFNAEDGKILIQAQKPGIWRKVVGMSTATNILLSQNKGKMIVEIGLGRWYDKIAGGVIGRLWTPYLWAPAAYGAFEQWTLPDKLFAYFNEGEQEVTA